jgi:hypothetical protein
MKTHKLFTEYGQHMLPVIIRAIKDKRAGSGALSEFLCQAQEQLERQQKISQARRRLVSSQTGSRREKLFVARYFDLIKRIQRAQSRALESLENYLQVQDEALLDEALRQYETGERFQLLRIQARIGLAPILCERISRAS